LDTVQGHFFHEATSIIETEATPATGTIEIITGTETKTGIETEAGTEAITEIGTTVTAAEPKTGTTTETITVAVETLDQMIAEATQETGVVEAQEAMLLAQHLREAEMVEQKLPALHQEVVRTTGERKY
jgi:hypothetical protein